jgi:predicted aldo/keto reductase-like oxidoreductase
MEYMMTTTMRKNRTNASLCVKCGKCEQHCPQHLPIRKELENVVRRLETPVYKAGAAIMKIAMRY